MGGYYLTALAAILGPVRSVAAFTATNDPDRVNTRIGAPGFGQAYDVQVPNVISATMQYANGVLGTLHMNSDCIEDEETCLKIYGTEGISPWATRTSSARRCTCRSRCVSRWNSRSRTGIRRTPAVSARRRWPGPSWPGATTAREQEMAYHVFETMHGIMTSAETGSFCQLQSTFQTPAALPLPDTAVWATGPARKNPH